MPVAVPADAASLLRQHRELLARLPVTFRAFVGVEAEKWPTSFPPERAYLAALLEALGGVDVPDVFAAVVALETEAGCRDVKGGDARQLQDATQALLRRKGLLPRWRLEVERVFQRLQPEIDRRLHPADAPRRVVVLLYGQGIAIQRDKLWGRLRRLGVHVPLRLDGAGGPDAFLRALLGLRGGTTLPAALADQAWLVEAGDAFHALGETGGGGVRPVALSYERLRPHRDRLAQSLYQKVMSGVSGPQELAAYARTLDVRAPDGTALHPDEVVRAFARDVLLGGNGTLLVNNTFVEWASVQALKRAEPRLLVTRFGVRDKLKPFSSLLLFSSPRPTDQIPILEDPFGSFVDAEQFAYYVWLNAEKSAAYRGRTLYLLLAESVDEMVAIRSDAPRTEAGELPPATLAEVAATMAAWLGLAPDVSPGTPIAALAHPA
jgi:hypothetical protein